MTVVEDFVNQIPFKLEPALLHSGDRVGYSDMTWLIGTVYRDIKNNPVYNMDHMWLSTTASVKQTELDFLRRKQVGPIWTVDMFFNGKQILHNEDACPGENSQPLFLNIKTDRWTSVSFDAWTQDYYSENELAHIVLVLRTQSGHYVDGWYIEDCRPMRQRQQDKNWELWLDYRKATSIAPKFEEPKVTWLQCCYQDYWTGTGILEDMELTREAETWTECKDMGQVYENNYKAFCIDYIKYS